MNDVLWYDSETFAVRDLKTQGSGRYTEDDALEITLVSYARNDEPFKVFDTTTGEPWPADLVDGLLFADGVVAHNAMFDRRVLRKVRPDICPEIERWHCSMVHAYSHSLPGGLDRLCQIFHVEEDKAKDADGKKLIHLFCKPRPEGHGLRRATRLTHPAEWAHFKEYARRDGEAMREVAQMMPKWNMTPTERRYYIIDQQMNDRGVQVDMQLVSNALTLVKDTQAELADEIEEATEGEVTSATRRDQLLKHILEAYDVQLPDMKKSTLERRLEDPYLEDGVKELIRIRLAAATTSTGKYKAFKNATSEDGRLRCSIQFNGALRTGRAAARKVQPHNFPRPDMKKDQIAFAIEAIRNGVADLVYPARGDPGVMDALRNALRGAFIAPPGKKFCIADYSNIEGRGLAVLAGEEWKLDAFRAYDTFVLDEDGEKIPEGKEFKRLGPDLYKLAYSRAFQHPIELVTDEQRQIGKVMELALGYQGGVGAFVTFALVYGMDLDDLAAKARPVIPEDVWTEADRYWKAIQGKSDTKRRTLGLSYEVFCTCDSLKRLWRRAHPKTVKLWDDLADAFRMAIRFNRATDLGMLKVDKAGSWVRIQLPSGRYLCYPAAKCEQGDNGQITYAGVNQYTRQWARIRTYGGKCVENSCQAFARDILWYGLDQLDQRGYTPVLSIHDEDITEVPDTSEFTHEAMCEIMSVPPPWAPDMPLAVAGFTAKRYRK